MVVGPGAVNTATPWRSYIFERRQEAQPARLDLPFAPHERLPLIHVEDVAQIIQQLISAEQSASSIYNSPAENWTAGDLARELQALNQNLEVTFAASHGRGDPEAINGTRFMKEFVYQSILVRQRLERFSVIEN